MYKTNQGRRRWAIAAYYFVVAGGQLLVPASLQDRIIKPISLVVDAFGTQQHHHHHRHEQFNVRIQQQQQHQQRQPSTSVAFASKSVDSNEAAATMTNEAIDTTATTRTENEKQARYVSSIIKRARFAPASEKTTTTTTTNTTRLVSSSASASAVSAFNNEYRKKRKQRVIEKIKRKYFSYQIESRILRILLYPIKLLIWTPLRIVIDMLIDRLDEEGTGVVDNSNIATCRPTMNSTDSSDVAPLSATTVASEVVQDNVGVANTTITTTTTGTPEFITHENNREQILQISNSTGSSTSCNGNGNGSSSGGGDQVSHARTRTYPIGNRWATAAAGVDLSGMWELIITKEFKADYDVYLERLGQSRIVRSVALSPPVLKQTHDEVFQTNSGRSLAIRGKNIRGTWYRTLIASGTSLKNHEFTPLRHPLLTIDAEQVEAESWWEKNGTIHVSYLRGITLYGGGTFLSRRYMEEQNTEDVYVCESAFEFNDPNKVPNKLTWRFRRTKTR